MTCMTSSLEPRGPSPSELVWAWTKCTSQSGGASSRIRCSASPVSVQVRETAFPSTTSSGISLDRNADDFLPAPQLVDQDIDLFRRSDELEIEGAVGFVLVCAA